MGKEKGLPEAQTFLSLPVKLGGCVFPAGIPAPDVEGRELYSLLMSHREREFIKGMRALKMRILVAGHWKFTMTY